MILRYLALQDLFAVSRIGICAQLNNLLNSNTSARKKSHKSKNKNRNILYDHYPAVLEFFRPKGDHFQNGRKQKCQCTTWESSNERNDQIQMGDQGSDANCKEMNNKVDYKCLHIICIYGLICIWPIIFYVTTWI